MFAPDSVSVPPASVMPPPPLMAPEKLPEALAKVSVLAPRATLPEPDRVWTEVPAPDTPEMSNAPLATTPLELAMLPAPDSASVPAVIVVRPL